MSLKYVSTIFVAAMLAMAVVLTATVAQPKKAEAAGTVVVKGCTGSKIALKTDEKRMLDLHNKTRTAKGLPRLCVHPALQKAARAHSTDMINRDYFSHNTKGSGKTFAARIRSAGYKYRTAGENIANGSGSLGTPTSIYKAWMGSTGHRKNILNKGFREVGISAASGNYQGTDGYTAWTADFGTR